MLDNARHPTTPDSQHFLNPGLKKYCAEGPTAHRGIDIYSNMVYLFYKYTGMMRCTPETSTPGTPVLHQHANRKKIEDPLVGSEPTLSNVTPNLQWC